MSTNLFIHNELGLTSVLIFWRFIGEGFNKLICEDLNVCPSIGIFFNFYILWMKDFRWLFQGVSLRDINIFRSNQSRICVTSKYSFIPHQIVVDKFTS